ncbi:MULTISPECIES: VOC family protein [unclassified Paenibacillus]|uniref:VOC family protein n=1 Tax=unclassified Paenibacillus TaxID=185978 RepID=UPI000CFD40CA|nr:MULTISPECIES: VOC family protein [unclassified Paenibacillus]PRA07592.1 extradiol dioxygenase [Paenibacillus sp. MYb63]PRA51237.1 extradiol dioxygenase [Paenibacillus sp. MYb67]QZN74361.1 extradiol dioxygenase [Paenibacillus sp. DR312]
MSQKIWMNLPVKDVVKSTTFFNEIGFHGENVGNERAQLVIGSTTILLFPDATFEKFTGAKIADTSHSAEVIFSIGADSREEVDAFIKKVELAGGTIFGKPGETDGWMYGAGFADLDGHRWNLLYMDESKMPKR